MWEREREQTAVAQEDRGRKTSKSLTVCLEKIINSLKEV